MLNARAGSVLGRGSRRFAVARSDKSSQCSGYEPNVRSKRLVANVFSIHLTFLRNYELNIGFARVGVLCEELRLVTETDASRISDPWAH
jgi:hypothetical protein